MGLAVLVVVFLAAGPAFAYLVVAMGCAQPVQLLGVMCGHNAVLSLVAFSLLGWLFALVGAAIVNLRRKRLQ